MKRKYVIGIIIAVLLVVAGFAGRSIYKERYSDEMKKSLDITNSTNVKFKAIGIAWKDNVVFRSQTKMIILSRKFWTSKKAELEW